MAATDGALDVAPAAAAAAVVVVGGGGGDGGGGGGGGASTPCRMTRYESNPSATLMARRLCTRQRRLGSQRLRQSAAVTRSMAMKKGGEIRTSVSRAHMTRVGRTQCGVATRRYVVTVTAPFAGVSQQEHNIVFLNERRQTLHRVTNRWGCLRGTEPTTARSQQSSETRSVDTNEACGLPSWTHCARAWESTGSDQQPRSWGGCVEWQPQRPQPVAKASVMAAGVVRGGKGE